MNRYEEIYSLIEIINEKINNIDKELLKVEEQVSRIAAMLSGLRRKCLTR